MSPNTEPGSSAPSCQVVGIGASAGGLESLKRFFHAVPPAPGMAFIVIQHLSPDSRSIMDELPGRLTALPVQRAEDGVEVKPDTVYVLLPAKDMIVADGRLHLTDKDPAQSPTLPIDHFFCSLAHEYGPRAAAVVMSGNGSDGSRGIHEVHDAGGFVLAESEDTARLDGMPGSARRSGIVDRVLPPEEMPQALVHWARGTRAEGEPAGAARAPSNADSIEGVVLSLVDVTVLERARRDLSRLSAIVQSTDDAIIGKSTTGMITSWNAGAEQLYGFTAEEAIGRPLSLCVPPERLAETEDALNRVLRGERLAHYESMRVRKGGEMIDVSVRVSPVLDETGAVVGASSISRDITGRKRTERRLQAEHAVARLAAEATSFEETAPRLGEALRESLGVDVVEFYAPDAMGRMTPVSGTPIATQPATIGAADGDGIDVQPTAGDLAPAALPLDTAWPEQARQSGRAALVPGGRRRAGRGDAARRGGPPRVPERPGVPDRPRPRLPGRHRDLLP